MTIPSSVRSAVGLADGDLVEVRAVGKKIVIVPHSAIDRSKFPNSDGEYTPAQRRAIDARLVQHTLDKQALLLLRIGDTRRTGVFTSALKAIPTNFRTSPAILNNPGLISCCF